MKTVRIGRTEFNLDALKGVSKSKFLKGHTVEQWEALQKHLKKK